MKSALAVDIGILGSFPSSNSSSNARASRRDRHPDWHVFPGQPLESPHTQTTWRALAGPHGQQTHLPNNLCACSIYRRVNIMLSQRACNHTWHNTLILTPQPCHLSSHTGRHPHPREGWWSHRADLRDPSGHRQGPRRLLPEVYVLHVSPAVLEYQYLTSLAFFCYCHLQTSTKPRRRRSRTSFSRTTVPFSSLTRVARKPRSSVVARPALVSRSRTVKRYLHSGRARSRGSSFSCRYHALHCWCCSLLGFINRAAQVLVVW